MRFLDTNVLIYLLINSPIDQARNARQLLLAVEGGRERVIASPLVIFETVFVLERRYGASMREIRDSLVPIIELSGFVLTDKAVNTRAFDLAIDLNVDFPDAFNAAFMEAHGLSEAYSWDRHFERFDNVRRIEPGRRTGQD